MKNNNGWIKLHRQITENVLWRDDEPFDRRSAWIDLLMMVNHEERQIMVNGEIVTVGRGETLTSEVKLAKRWRWSRNRVRRYLEAIQAAQMVNIKRTGYGTWLNVVNYGHFQDRATSNDTGVDTGNDTAGDTGVDTAGGTQTRNNKNYKNDKEDNNFFCADALKKIPPDRSDVEAYCREKKYRGVDIDGFFEYYDMRDWKLTGGLKMPDWTKAIDYWHSKGKKDAEQGQVESMPYFKEFDNGSMVVGSEMPFKNGLASEVIRRRREKNEQRESL